MVKDSKGIFPLVGRLTPSQFLYHYASGYGNIAQSGENRRFHSFFLSCYDENRAALAPEIYVRQMEEKLRLHNPELYVVNTGYYGGSSEDGTKIDISFSQMLLKSIVAGTLKGFKRVEGFGFEVPSEAGDTVLPGAESWPSQDEYLKARNVLIDSFIHNWD